MHITHHKHYTFKNICISSYSDGRRNLCKAASADTSCSIRLRHFLAGIILVIPVANCIAQTLFIRSERKHSLQKRVSKTKKTLPPSAKKKRTTHRQHKHKSLKISNPTNPFGDPASLTQKAILFDPEIEITFPKVPSFIVPSSSNPAAVKTTNRNDLTNSFSNSSSPPDIPFAPEIEATIPLSSTDTNNLLSTRSLLPVAGEDSDTSNPTKAWREYLTSQGVSQKRTGIRNSYNTLPSLELLNALLKNFKSEYEWGIEFLRDCAFVYPEFAIKCITEDRLWKTFAGCSEEVTDICQKNPLAAWSLIQSREVYYRPQILLDIFQGSLPAIITEPDLTYEKLETLDKFLANCYHPIRQIHYDSLSKIHDLLLSNLLDQNKADLIERILNKWKNELTIIQS